MLVEDGELDVEGGGEQCSLMMVHLMSRKEAGELVVSEQLRRMLAMLNRNCSLTTGHSMTRKEMLE